MSSWLARHDDAPAPTVAQAARDIGVRALVPLLGLIVANLAVGFFVTGWDFEDAVNAQLQAGRTPALDAVARVASAIGSAPGNIALCVLFMALLWWRTRRWWVALLPGLALTLEAIVHAVTSTVVNRTRPAVEHLDAAQPTASFPSGHTGATVAQVMILLLLLRRLDSALARVAVAVASLGFVVVLSWSRLYLGMHHVSDVAVGVLNGVACALLAWNYRRLPPPAHVLA